MTIKDYITTNYPGLSAFSGIEEARELLLENSYVVVFDDEQDPALYCGILTMADVIRSSHRLIIDCLTPKVSVNSQIAVTDAYRLMNERMLFVLPVFSGNDFIGVVEKKMLSLILGRRNDRLRKKSELSEKAKDEFLHNLSHEIRTPLNSILGFMDLIAELKYTDWSRVDSPFVENIERNADNFLIVMNDIVELALVRSGEPVKARMQEIELNDFFDGLLKSFGKQLNANSKSIILKVINDGNEKRIFSDGEKMKHIFFHLIEELVLVAGDKAEIHFGAEHPEGKEFILFVRGKQILFPKEIRSRLLKIIDQPVEHSFNRDEIRIVIAAYLVAALNGEIHWAEEQGDTTFKMRFPILHKDPEQVLT